MGENALTWGDNRKELQFPKLPKQENWMGKKPEGEANLEKLNYQL